MAKKIRLGSAPLDDLFPEGIEDGGPDTYFVEPGRLEQGLSLVGAQNVRPLGPATVHFDQHSRPAESRDPVDTQPVQLLDPLAQPRFVNDLPLPDRIDA